MSELGKSTHQKKVDRANFVARYIITVGGYGIIISIIGILLFLIYQSLPLGFKASIKKMFTLKIENPVGRVYLAGVDQYKEVGYLLYPDGEVSFYDLNRHDFLFSDSFPLSQEERILSARKGSLNREIFAIGTDKGKILTAEIKMVPRYHRNERIIEPTFHLIDTFSLAVDKGFDTNHIEKLAFCRNDDDVLIWSWLDHQGEVHLLIDGSDDEENYSYQLTSSLGKEKLSVMTISDNGQNLIIGSRGGELFWFDLSEPSEVYLKDNWKASQYGISAIRFLIGDNSLVVGDEEGAVDVWFPVRQENNLFRFVPIHHFNHHPASVDQIYISPRNRSFLSIDRRGEVHLNFSTSGKTQLEFKRSDNGVQTGGFAPKSDAIFLVDKKERYTLYHLDNEHPEATLKTLFGEVWYEGYNEPEFVWQSTGGSDEFEPKLNLIPLIFGTMKGTFYAMIFSVPIAILAAVYVSYFSPKWLARTIKPTVEIMAALPSVVIGFLAGLYFSPLFEKHFMTIFLFVIFLPFTFLVGVSIWRLIPEQKRMRFPVGWELLFVLPLIIINLILVLSVSSQLEMILFNGDITQWIFNSLGQTYDQRNSIVVGFALGFAVIPIIFTISEDALSNVPESLTSASLALGASRWQTVRKVVFPAAAGGIFAAVMLGFGRAIGETMIVLMATGNTPIIDLSPFNGFRAMSACIAVEIPEAPVGGTLYRVLFLIAFLLFLFTFIINSLSAIISDRLRKKYARF